MALHTRTLQLQTEHLLFLQQVNTEDKHKNFTEQQANSVAARSPTQFITSNLRKSSSFVESRSGKTKPGQYRSTEETYTQDTESSASYSENRHARLAITRLQARNQAVHPPNQFTLSNFRDQ